MCVDLWNNGTEPPSGLKGAAEISCGQNTIFAQSIFQGAAAFAAGSKSGWRMKWSVAT